MKKIKFIKRQANNYSEKVIMIGKVGEHVFSIVNNVKETNDAIRWCNTHKLGDRFEFDDYSMEIVEG